jgi:hypothetical protein
MDMMLPTGGVMLTGENVYDAVYWWSNADGKIEVLRENLVTVTPQIPHGLDCVCAGPFVVRR